MIDLTAGLSGVVILFSLYVMRKLIIDTLLKIVSLMKEIDRKLQWVLEYQKRQLYRNDYKGFQPTDKTEKALMDAVSKETN